ncbi:hypothetical protein Pcar_3464 [Syntrophotalea carbinolica DSM 2380]|uniref:Uncharacterized protein n=1 Tax=Syntrophotalea carbinolica (strain DSM 2380 / NBRC 103641 / GraBd1) TaxID=338963 RepID=J9TJG4_SYNC1|nr:hypothetical protein Pcar_3464 [Syntrophotalea carbinolica DSM 2380]
MIAACLSFRYLTLARPAVRFTRCMHNLQPHVCHAILRGPLSPDSGFQKIFPSCGLFLNFRFPRTMQRR